MGLEGVFQMEKKEGNICRANYNSMRERNGETRLWQSWVYMRLGIHRLDIRDGIRQKGEGWGRLWKDL